MAEDPAGAAAGHDGQPGGETQPGGEAPPGWGAQPGWETPWPESPTTGTGRRERADLETAFAAGLRRTGALMQLMGTAAADKIGINATDLNCLEHLSFSGSHDGKRAGPGHRPHHGLHHRGGRPALEEAGFVTRERDPHDRRRVVVQINLDRAMKDVATIFAPMLRSWREMSARYSDDELRLIVDFYGRMEQVFREHLLRLRGGPEAAEP
jgi:hypothetical protein